MVDASICWSTMTMIKYDNDHNNHDNDDHSNYDMTVMMMMMMMMISPSFRTKRSISTDDSRVWFSIFFLLFSCTCWFVSDDCLFVFNGCLFVSKNCLFVYRKFSLLLMCFPPSRPSAFENSTFDNVGSEKGQFLKRKKSV